MFQSKLKWIHIILAVAMIVTGFLYPLAPYFTMQGLWVETFGLLGLFAYSMFTITSGIALLLNLNTNKTYLYTAPILLLNLMLIANSSFSLTAIVTHFSLWFLANHIAFVNRELENKYLSPLGYAITFFRPAQLLGAMLFIMFVFLLDRPNGTGLEYIFNYLQFFNDPVTFYQAIFGVGATLLVFGFYINRFWLIFIMASPLLLHTGLFTLIALTEFQAFALVPYLFASFCINALFILEYY